MSPEVVVGIVGAAIALAGVGWTVFVWVQDRRRKASEAAEASEREAERRADDVVVFIERARRSTTATCRRGT